MLPSRISNNSRGVRDDVRGGRYTCAPPPDEHTPEVSNAPHKETFTRHAALAIILHSQALAIILNSHSMPPPSRRRSELRMDFGHPNVLCDGGLQ